MISNDEAAAWTVNRAEIGRLERIGLGGTASVYRCSDYRIPGVSSVVYKEYKTRTREAAGPSLFAGLHSLVRTRIQLGDSQRRVWDSLTVWPLLIVIEDAQVVGVLMQLIDEDYFCVLRGPSGVKMRKPADVDILLGADNDLRVLGGRPPKTEDRISICAHIVRTYSLIHRRGVVLGDISARNVLFRPERFGPVLIVDTDSARAKGSRSPFGQQPHTPSWEPPEALRALSEVRRLREEGGEASARLKFAIWEQSSATDVYKVGLLLVRILDHGRHRSRNRSPDRAAQLLRAWGLRGASDMLASSLAAEPAQRPSLSEWARAWDGDGDGDGDGGDGSALSSGRPDVSVASREQTDIGSLSGSWVWREGQGWTRRPHGG